MLGCCRDPSRRTLLYDEAARVLGSGQVVSHCMYTFARDALHDCLEHSDHERLEEHVKLLEAYTGPYDVDWGKFFCEWAQRLSAWHRGAQNDAARASLLALGTRARELGLRSESLRIERALEH
jgi:hypothetical protein